MSKKQALNELESLKAQYEAKGISEDSEPIWEIDEEFIERSASVIFENFKESERRRYGHTLTKQEEVETKIILLNDCRKLLKRDNKEE